MDDAAVYIADCIPDVPLSLISYRSACRFPYQPVVPQPNPRYLKVAAKYTWPRLSEGKTPKSAAKTLVKPNGSVYVHATPPAVSQQFNSKSKAVFPDAAASASPLLPTPQHAPLNQPQIAAAPTRQLQVPAPSRGVLMIIYGW